VIGTAEPGTPQGAMGKWGRAKATLQVTQWFGTVPHFIITIDAEWWLQASDAEACALGNFARRRASAPSPFLLTPTQDHSSTSRSLCQF